MTDAAPGPSAQARTLLWLGVGLALVAGLFLIDWLAPTLFPASLPTRAQDGLTLAISVLIESLPFVALGVVLSIVVQVWVPPGVIERWMPRRAWARRAVLSLLGMIVPVCECGNVPFARGLLMRGFSVPETLTFLIAAPIVNPIVILTTHQAFGFSDGILVARILGGYAIANLIGWLYSRHPSPDALLTDRFRDTCELVTHEPGGRWPDVLVLGPHAQRRLPGDGPPEHGLRPRLDEVGVAAETRKVDAQRVPLALVGEDR